jgi:hypothetical protein
MLRDEVFGEKKVESSVRRGRHMGWCVGGSGWLKKTELRTALDKTGYARTALCPPHGYRLPK